MILRRLGYVRNRNSKTHQLAWAAICLGVAIPLASFATTLAPNFTLEGRLLNAAAIAASTDTVDFTVGVYSPSGLCLLYEQKYQNVDLSLTDGFYRLTVGSNLGSASRTTRDPGKTIAQIFSNTSAIRADDSGTTSTCIGGYAPVAGDQRIVRITVMPHSTGVAETLSPDLSISPVPHATVAESVQGLTPEFLLQIIGNSTPYVFNFADIDRLFGPTGPGGTAAADASTMHHHDSLYAKLSGSASLSLNAGAYLGLGSRAGDPAGMTAADAGKTWYDSTVNAVKYWDGSAVKTLSTAAGGVTSVSVDAGSPITVGGTASAPSIGITQASSISSGYLANTDFAAFSGKFGATSTLAGGNIWVGNASNNPVAVALSGDATLSNAGALTVSRIQGTPVSSTAPATNQVLQFDGTRWAPSAFSASQWTTSGANIYYNAGNVGIGTTNPSGTLDVEGGTSTTGSGVGITLNSQNGIANGSNSNGGTIALLGGTGSVFGAGGQISLQAGTNINGGGGGGTLSLTGGLYGGQAGTTTLAGGYGGNGLPGGPITITGGNAWSGVYGDVYIAPNGGKVGIGTTSPQTALDVNGVVRVAKYSAQPFACDAAHDASLAITSGYRQCICKGGSSLWVFTSDGTTACAW